jgi:hypothetical protein
MEAEDRKHAWKIVSFISGGEDEIRTEVVRQLVDGHVEACSDMMSDMAHEYTTYESAEQAIQKSKDMAKETLREQLRELEAALMREIDAREIDVVTVSIAKDGFESAMWLVK